MLYIIIAHMVFNETLNYLCFFKCVDEKYNVLLLKIFLAFPDELLPPN